MALGQSRLAWPGQLLQAPPPTGLEVGGQRRRPGRRVKNSWVKVEFKRKEMQQDGKTTEEYSCLHCRAAVHIDVEQMEVDEEGFEQREGDEEGKGDEKGDGNFEFQRRPLEMVGCSKEDRMLLHCAPEVTVTVLKIFPP